MVTWLTSIVVLAPVTFIQNAIFVNIAVRVIGNIAFIGDTIAVAIQVRIISYFGLIWGTIAVTVRLNAVISGIITIVNVNIIVVHIGVIACPGEITEHDLTRITGKIRMK